MTHEISENEIHLWLAFDNEIHTESLLTDYRRLLLSEDERQQEQRFYFEKHRHQYLVTRALVRTILSRYASVAPERWNFNRNEHGRPEITNDDDSAKTLSFNLSHTDGLIMLGVTRTPDLGVDTENIRRQNAFLSIAEHFFSRKEVAALHRSPEEIRRERFFHYWTLKESYIKARGKGLSIPLDQFGFEFSDDRSINAICEPTLESSLSDWRFWLLGFGIDHVAAVCARRISASPQNLIVRKVVPLVSEAAMDYEVLRQSE